MVKKEKVLFLMLIFFFSREICQSVLGKVCLVITLEIGPASLDKHTLNSSWSTSAAHSPTETPASDPPPEKNHCYSVAFYSWTSGHGQPEVPWGEMKSWNMMLLLGLLAKEKRKCSNKIYAKSRLSGRHKLFFICLIFTLWMFSNLPTPPKGTFPES